jgi:uncharacterized membrane protein
VLLATWHSMAAEGRARWLAWMVPQFSKAAIPTTAFIALTGIYMSLLEIPSFQALLQTSYGGTLSLKVMLFVVMVGFGALNLFWFSPRFRRAVRERQVTPRLFSKFRLTVSVEGLLGAGVILLAGLLTLEPPARTALVQPAPVVPAPSLALASPGVLLVDEAAPDVEVALTIKPTIADVAGFDVYLTDPRFPVDQLADAPSGTTGAPIPNALRVMVQFTLLDRDLGVITQTASSQGDGHYLVPGNYLTMPGMWKLHVVVQRAGLDDVAANFPVYKATVPVLVGPSNPEALDLLKDSDRAMNELQSLCAQQDMNDGSDGVVITDYEYRAPNSMDFQVRGQVRSVAIGRSQYYLGKQGTWTERQRVDAFAFPQFNFSEQARDAQLGRTEVVKGEVAQVVRYIIPGVGGGGEAQIAEWISSRDHRLLQLAMNAPDHYMMQYYFDYNSPQIVIAAPVAARP